MNTTITPTWIAFQFVRDLGHELGRITTFIATRKRHDLRVFELPVLIPEEQDIDSARSVIATSAREMAKRLKRRHMSRFYEFSLNSSVNMCRVRSNDLGISASYMVEPYTGAGKFRVLVAPCHK